MASTVSRASLLRGRLRGGAAAIRPPWAVGESAFVDACTRCGDCIPACAEGIIHAGSGGFPEVSFANGECTFCGDCRTACRTGALGGPDRNAENDDDVPWLLDVRVGAQCLGDQGVVCRLCEEQCEADAIAFPKLGGVGVPRIDAASCNGCGACISYCPADAITARPLQPTERAA